jgi:hypothetical protein
MLEPRLDAEGGGRRSSVPGFDATLRHLFPEVEDAENAMGVAEQMLLLKRRLDQRLAETPPQADPAPEGQPRRGWWPFGR